MGFYPVSKACSSFISERSQELLEYSCFIKLLILVPESLLEITYLYESFENIFPPESSAVVKDF